MPNARRAAEIFLSVAQMKQDPGPIIPHYAVPLDLPFLFKWIPGDSTTTDDVLVIGHTGGTGGRWHRVRYDGKGDDLTDADATIYLYDGRIRYVPSGTLTVNRVLTIDETNASAGDELTIVRIDSEAFTLQIDDGASSTTITTLPAGESWSVDLRFNGASFELLRAGQLP